MSDLISRSDVTKVIDELEVYTVGRLNTQKVEISVLQLQRFINTLKDIPTAYNPDKVVEELEENSSNYKKSYKANGKYIHKTMKAISRIKAIDIVKRGGVE